MLQYNPIRAEHEMKWYLESRFPGRKVERLDVGVHARVPPRASPRLVSDRRDVHQWR